MVRLIIKALLVISLFANDVMAQKKGTLKVAKRDSSLEINNSPDTVSMSSYPNLFFVLSFPNHNRVHNITTIVKKNTFKDTYPTIGSGLAVGIAKPVKERLFIYFTGGAVNWKKIQIDSVFAGTSGATPVKIKSVSFPFEINQDVFFIRRGKYGIKTRDRSYSYWSHKFGVTCSAGLHASFSSFQFMDISGSPVKKEFKQRLLSYGIGVVYSSPLFYFTNISLRYGRIGANNYLSLHINLLMWE